MQSSSPAHAKFVICDCTIELAFRLLKQHLGVRVLWSAKWEVLGVQLWGCLILAQILHSWQVRLAWEEEVEPYDVSLQLLLQQLRMGTPVGPALRDLVHERGRLLGIVRPSTRHQIEVPEEKPEGVAWPPPEEVLQPRPARYARKGGTPASARTKAQEEPQQASSPFSAGRTN